MDTHDGSALPPGTRIDQYAISGLLGRGGFGITYLVRDEALNRDFALKEFFPECRNSCLPRTGCLAYEFRLRNSICVPFRTVTRQKPLSDAVSVRWD